MCLMPPLDRNGNVGRHDIPMAFKMQSAAHALTKVHEVRVVASIEETVLSLKRAVAPDEAHVSPRAGSEWMSDQPEGIKPRLEASNVQCQTEQTAQSPPKPKPAAAKRHGAVRPLKSHMRLLIFRIALIATWCCSNIALLLSNRLATCFANLPTLPLCTLPRLICKATCHSHTSVSD